MDKKWYLLMIGGVALLWYFLRGGKDTSLEFKDTIPGELSSGWRIDPQTGLKTSPTGFIYPSQGNEWLGSVLPGAQSQYGINSVSLTPDGHYDVIFYAPYSWADASGEPQRSVFNIPSGYSLLNIVDIGGGYQHISVQAV